MASRILGAGVLDPFLAEPHVTDVAVNGDGRVWIDRGNGMEWTGDQLSGDDARLLAVRLAGSAGRRLDEASPWVDGQLPSGARLHAILPPLVAGGAHITIRVPPREQTSLVVLGERGMFPPTWLAVLQAIVRHRLAFLVSGGTGAGKTTLLAALLGCADPGDRLLLVEDVRELAVDHPHVVRLEARPANVEGAGEITLTTLVRQSLRMRPDRIVVGEVRGAEVRELLAALNTGHEGGCGTIHANAPADVMARLEALGALAGLGSGGRPSPGSRCDRPRAARRARRPSPPPQLDRRGAAAARRSRRRAGARLVRRRRGAGARPGLADAEGAPGVARPPGGCSANRAARPGATSSRPADVADGRPGRRGSSAGLADGGDGDG